jgi:hypothetical protein
VDFIAEFIAENDDSSKPQFAGLVHVLCNMLGSLFRYPILGSSAASSELVVILLCRKSALPRLQAGAQRCLSATDAYGQGRAGD